MFPPLLSPSYRQSVLIFTLSTLLYFTGYSWYEYCKAAYFSWSSPIEPVPVSTKGSYALLVTITAMVLAIIVYQLLR